MKKIKKGKWNIIMRTRGEDFSLMREALYSVAIQDYENKEVVLVYHPDRTKGKAHDKDVRKKLKNLIEKIEPLVHIKLVEVKQEKASRGTPLNIGLDNCDGEFISHLDYDDVYYPGMGSRLIGEMKAYNYDFVYGNSIVVRQVRSTTEFGLEYLYNISTEKGYGEEYNPLKFLFDNYIPLNTYIHRVKEGFDARFDERLDIAEDWDFLLTLFFKEGYEPVYVDYNVSEYRHRQDMTHSFSQYTKKKRRRSRQLIYSKIAQSEYSFKGKYVNEVRNHFMPDQDTDTIDDPYTVRFALSILKKYFVNKTRSSVRIIKEDGLVYFIKIVFRKTKRNFNKIMKA